MRLYRGEGFLGLKSQQSIYFIRSGEFRKPKVKEYYLSGANPLAYRAPGNLSTKYHIMIPYTKELENKRTTRAVLKVVNALNQEIQTHNLSKDETLNILKKCNELIKNQ